MFLLDQHKIEIWSYTRTFLVGLNLSLFSFSVVIGILIILLWCYWMLSFYWLAVLCFGCSSFQPSDSYECWVWWSNHCVGCKLLFLHVFRSWITCTNNFFVKHKSVNAFWHILFLGIYVSMFFVKHYNVCCKTFSNLCFLVRSFSRYGRAYLFEHTKLDALDWLMGSFLRKWFYNSCY